MFGMAPTYDQGMMPRAGAVADAISGIGDIRFFASDPGAKWLKCDGRTVERNPALNNFLFPTPRGLSPIDPQLAQGFGGSGLINGEIATGATCSLLTSGANYDYLFRINDSGTVDWLQNNRPQTFRTIAWSDRLGRFLAAGSNGSNAIMYQSTDGGVWTVFDIGGATGINAIHGVHFDPNGRFVLDCTISGTRRLAWSDDFVNFTTFGPNLSGSIQYSYLNSVIGSNGRVYIIWRYFDGSSSYQLNVYDYAITSANATNIGFGFTSYTTAAAVNGKFIAPLNTSSQTYAVASYDPVTGPRRTIFTPASPTQDICYVGAYKGEDTSVGFIVTDSQNQGRTQLLKTMDGEAVEPVTASSFDGLASGNPSRTEGVTGDKRGILVTGVSSGVAKCVVGASAPRIRPASFKLSAYIRIAA